MYFGDDIDVKYIPAILGKYWCEKYSCNSGAILMKKISTCAICSSEVGGGRGKRMLCRKFWWIPFLIKQKSCCMNFFWSRKQGCGFYSSVAVVFSVLENSKPWGEGRGVLEYAMWWADHKYVPFQSIKSCHVEMRDNSIFILSESGTGGSCGHFTYWWHVQSSRLGRPHVIY